MLCLGNCLGCAKCIVLAPPPRFRTGREIDRRFLENINTFINNDDCIPRISLASIAKLVKMVRTIDNLKLTAREHIQLIFQPGATQESVQNENKIKDAIDNIKQDIFEYLEQKKYIISNE